jgi:(1->4)-alpha-D-glucan 1-alpha-D-glucosylmutase
LRAYAERLKGAMVKSMRESKVHSTWAAPDAPYEDAMLALVDAALDPERSGAFLTSFLPFAEQVARLGAQNTLIQTVLKLTLPGVPDIYQGAELWDLSLVDPDNRRKVDYALRRRLLEEVTAALEKDRGAAMRSFMRNWQDGRFKLAAITTLLGVRRDHPDLFASGEYEPVQAEGQGADEVCAFLRWHEDEMMMVAVARFPARREAGGSGDDTMLKLPDAALARRRWRDLLGGVSVEADRERLSAAALFAGLPAAVLVPAS